MTKPLHFRAMLVSLSQRAWKASAADQEVASNAEQSVGAESGTMTVIKQLCPKHIIQPIRSIMTLGRAEHYKQTTPGLMKGQHLLAVKMFETYMLTQSAIKDEFGTAVNKYCSIYPEIRAAAKRKLAGAYKDADFPSEGQIKGFFGYEITTAPVPQSSDWRLEGMDAGQTEELRQQLEAGVHKMYADAMMSVYQRARLHLETLAKQADNWSSSAPGAMLRDATIDNFKEFCDLIGSMNVAGDPVIDQVAKDMQVFADMQGKELRQSADRRKEIAGNAKRILAKLDAPARRKVAA